MERQKRNVWKQENVSYAVKGELLTIGLPKEVDHKNADVIKKETDRLIYSGQVKNVEFDFTDTDFCDSSGIGMILGRRRLLNASGGKIILSGVHGNVERIINLSGIYKLI